MPNAFPGGEGVPRKMNEESNPDMREDIQGLFARLDAAYSPSLVDHAARELGGEADPETADVARELENEIEHLKGTYGDEAVNEGLRDELQRRVA